MAGICRPRVAREPVHALKQETGLPIQFHTHDTSGISAASVLAAVEGPGRGGWRARLHERPDSQPNLGAIAASLAGSERDPKIDFDALQQLSNYWKASPLLRAIRSRYPFRHRRCPSPRNARRPVHQPAEQARSLGLEQRWPEVSKAYADVNQLFGDIVKVTPTSKVVGDMALFMVGNNLTPEQTLSDDTPSIS